MNLTKPASYPYGLKAPVPHDELNEICEQYSKAPNADDGSAHAPTADIEWSGAGTGGFSFDTTDPFPFYGYLDVRSGLRFTAPVSGQVRFNDTVAIDIFSTNMTLQSGALLTLASGAQISVSSGATVTHASGSTTNLTGAVNFRGAVIFKSTANGGPASLTLESDVPVAVGTSAWTWQAASVQTYLSGATVAGPYARTGRTTWSGTGARQQHRAVEVLDGTADADITVEHDRYQIPLTLTGNRVYTVRHTGVVPTIGERVRVFRMGNALPSAHLAAIENEAGTVLFKFYISRMGFVVLEYTSGGWIPVESAQYATSTNSGIYDDTW